MLFKHCTVQHWAPMFSNGSSVMESRNPSSQIYTVNMKTSHNDVYYRDFVVLRSEMSGLKRRVLHYQALRLLCNCLASEVMLWNGPSSILSRLKAKYERFHRVLFIRAFLYNLVFPNEAITVLKSSGCDSSGCQGSNRGYWT